MSGQLSTTESLLCGGLAGACAKTVIAPADRLKILYQVSPSRKFTFNDAVQRGRRIAREGGSKALWKGHSATLMRVVPHAAIVFTVYDALNLVTRPRRTRESSDSQSENTGGFANLRHFLCGSASGVVATLACYPLELARARLAAEVAAHPSEPTVRWRVPRCLFAAWQEGGLPALYRGLWPTLIGVVPYAGCNFLAYEGLKRVAMQRRNIVHDRELYTYERVAAGCLAGLLGQSASYPFDIVRRRMQTSKSKTEGTFKLLKSILKSEGIRHGWFKALGMNWIKGPVAVSISFTVHDLSKNALLRRKRYNY
ncbi:MAG: hypothetical protein MHM6MM_000467 [Cercozoa sp. M6MM]